MSTQIKQRYEGIFEALEKEHQRVERDLQRMVVAAGHLGSVLAKLSHEPARGVGSVPTSKASRRAVRRRCDPPRRR